MKHGCPRGHRGRGRKSLECYRLLLHARNYNVLCRNPLGLERLLLLGFSGIRSILQFKNSEIGNRFRYLGGGGDNLKVRRLGGRGTSTAYKRVQGE